MLPDHVNAVAAEFLSYLVNVVRTHSQNESYRAPGQTNTGPSPYGFLGKHTRSTQWRGVVFGFIRRHTLMSRRRRARLSRSRPGRYADRPAHLAGVR
jgi:hypothetical protein